MRALVTGVAGQDGSYLAESLLSDGFEVIGTRRAEEDPCFVPAQVDQRILDLSHTPSIAELIFAVQPDVVFHLAGISSVASSWEDPGLTMQVNATATIVLLDACLRLQEQTSKAIRVVVATSAEIFGHSSDVPQTENTSIRPVNPYGVAKASAHHAVGLWRERGLGASSMILYNHESPRRPPQFVTRKITSTVHAISQGNAEGIALGNLDARRDWGWAPDYVQAMRLAATVPADDFIIATGEYHSVRDFVEAAFQAIGIENWEPYVSIDPQFYRPVEANRQVGDARKAEEKLGWKPSVSFSELVSLMVAAEHD